MKETKNIHPQIFSILFYVTGIKAHKCVICLRNFSTMGNLGAHVKSVHHLPFSKKLYQESLKASQVAEQQNNTDAAEQPQPSGTGTLPIPDAPTLALQAPLPTGGTIAGTGSSLQPLPGTSPPANAPVVLYDKKTLLEHYEKKVYQESAPSSNLAAAANVNSNITSNNENSQDMNRPSSVQSPQLLVTGGPVINQGNNTQEIRASAPPVVPAPPPSITTGGIQTQTVPPSMVHNMHDIARYQDMFAAAHPQHMMTHPPDLSYASNLPLPLYRPPTGPLHGSPM